MGKKEYSGARVLEIMTEAKRYNAWLSSLILKHAPQGTMMDIGAGVGTFAAVNVAKGYRVTCVEPDEQLRDHIRRKGLSVTASVNDIADESIDFIYALNVLEHVENDAETLSQWSKKLRQGGKMLIYVPAFKLLYSSFDQSIGHFRRYNKITLVRLMINAGIQVEKAAYADITGFFAALLFKCTDNGSGQINGKFLRLYDRMIFPLNRVLSFCSVFFGKNVYAVGTKRS
ncbi:MAG: class I SAM-dependent methyltransferase [Bacteroidales bacterium]|jgi:SAM-dependent methyltransferase|nr:class I SAM-dependent methyltransferase [Bacteroidales bacterium]